MVRFRQRSWPGAAFALVVACRAGSSMPPRTPAEDAAALHEAVHAVTNVMVYDIFSPPQASRVYAYASVAAYEAMRHGDTSYRTLAGQVGGLTPVPAPPGGVEVSWPLAGVHAYLNVGWALTFSRERMDSLRRAMDQRFAASMSEAVYRASIAYGDTVARHVLAWAGSDRFTQSRSFPKFSVSTAPGRWVPTPPAYMDAVEPHWGMLRPFTLDTATQFRPEPPHPFSTAADSPFMREVREAYEASKGLTDDQRELTAFWDCNPYVMHVQGHTMFATKKVTPGGHWMGIAGIASRKAGADALRSAEVYARTSIALADGFISSWEEKYRSALVRPETVINKYVDETWEPLLQTPPFPEYTSGHSVISNAAAEVLTEEFGEQFAFADSTELEYGLPVRSFPSFRAAAAEAAISRLYGGIHFRRAIDQGSAQGKRIGAHVVARLHTRGAGAAVAMREVPGAARGASPMQPDVRE